MDQRTDRQLKTKNLKNLQKIHQNTEFLNRWLTQFVYPACFVSSEVKKVFLVYQCEINAFFLFQSYVSFIIFDDLKEWKCTTNSQQFIAFGMKCAKQRKGGMKLECRDYPSLTWSFHFLKGFSLLPFSLHRPHWADSVIESPCLSVCLSDRMSVCLDVCTMMQFGLNDQFQASYWSSLLSSLPSGERFSVSCMQDVFTKGLK